MCVHKLNAINSDWWVSIARHPFCFQLRGNSNHRYLYTMRYHQIMTYLCDEGNSISSWKIALIVTVVNLAGKYGLVSRLHQEYGKVEYTHWTNSDWKRQQLALSSILIRQREDNESIPRHTKPFTGSKVSVNNYRGSKTNLDTDTFELFKLLLRTSISSVSFSFHFTKICYCSKLFSHAPLSI